MTDVFDTSRPESDVSPPLRTARRTARLCRSGHHRRHCHSPLCQHAAFATARCPPSHSVGTAASRQRMGGYGGPGGQGQGRAPIRSFSLGKASGQASAQRALRLSPITHVASGRDGPGRTRQPAARLRDAAGPMRIARRKTQKTSPPAACARALQESRAVAEDMQELARSGTALPGPARGRALLISARPTTRAGTPSLLAARGTGSLAQLNRGQHR